MKWIVGTECNSALSGSSLKPIYDMFGGMLMEQAENKFSEQLEKKLDAQFQSSEIQINSNTKGKKKD